MKQTSEDAGRKMSNHFCEVILTPEDIPQERKGNWGKGTVISLCDLTGHLVQPWVDAGYEAVLVDPQHEFNHIRPGGRIECIADTVLGAAKRLGEIMRTEKVVFVAGFPPCTDVAVSGARWFPLKASKDKHFQAKAALVAEQCRMIGEVSGAPWFFENPVSVFAKIFGKANHSFHPHYFTGYCQEDNYVKTTMLWVGNGFVMPDKFKDESLGPPDNRIHKAPPSPERANFRSATPRGFAQALFEANRPD
jgi:hypothetical protein